MNVASRLPTPKDLSSVDVLFDEEAVVVQQRTLVMDRRAMNMPSSVPPPQADRTEETWASDAEASPESTQPARRILVAEARRWKRALGVAIFVSFAAGIAAAAGTQIAITGTQASGSFVRARTPASFVASGVRRLEENGTTAKKEAAPPKKQHKKKKKVTPAAAAGDAPEAAAAEEAPAPDVDANGLLNDGLGQ